MRSTDRNIVLILPVIALLIGFWVLVLGPKQSESGDLQGKIDELQTTLATAQTQISEGQAAQGSFKKDYADLVSLGTAAPAGDDQATLVYDMSKLGEKNDVQFRSFEVVPGTTTAAPVATTPAPAEGATTTDATAATATEAVAATLPLGATVGPAGLPTMPYDFTYLGDFFDVADMFGDLDDQVNTSDDGSSPVVRGRLLTIDGFALTANPAIGFPSVQADFSVTTYLVPDDQGLDAGATPAGPGATTTETTVSAPTTTPTAAVTP